MKRENDHGFIYIVLIKAHTGLGKISRTITGYEYSHIAVSLDPGLQRFVSFSRRSHFTPFDAGFTYEYRDSYAYGRHQRVQVKVFKIPVPAERLAVIRNYLAGLEADDDYLFNLYAMMTMPLLHGFKVDKTHNCMTFTARLIELSAVVKLAKPYWKYSILELDQLLADYFVYEGYLQKKGTDHPEYMKRPDLLTEVGHFLRLNVRLCKRMLGKGKRYGER